MQLSSTSPFSLQGRTPADLRNAQQAHWEKNLSQRPHMFGEECSDAGRALLAMLQGLGTARVLELGAGQGRDTLCFAAQGLSVVALDYAVAGVEAVRVLAAARGLAHKVEAVQHDVRQVLPLEDASVDACYAHMLLCMALTLTELRALCVEVHRVVRPGGIFVYTVRHEGDPQYGMGTHGGENMYETGGFMVHFFNTSMIDVLAAGFTLLEVCPFEEGPLPRKLWRVTLQKSHENAHFPRKRL